MGSRITLFSGYDQKENRTTNYCLLILKMIYEENPKFFAEVISRLTNEDVGSLVGVKFSQQEKKKNSVPDGLIVQESFAIYIETKNHPWFCDSQLEKHLEALNNNNSNFKILLALGKFDNDIENNNFDKIKNICNEKYKNKIFFEAISFEDLVDAISLEHISKNLSDTISDFIDYLNGYGYLPTWQYWLDVINCATTPHEIENNVYMCPAEGGQYNHSRCKYFGMYKNKTVSKIALIKAVVDIISADDIKLKWKNIDEDETQLKNIAFDKFNTFRPNLYPTRVFVLGDLYLTNFIKDTPRGMQGNHQYFDISQLNIQNAEELSQKLNNKTWKNYID